LTRIRLRPQHCPGSPQALREDAIGANWLGPAAILKGARIGFEANVGIDQRGPAQTAAQKHIDIAAEANIKECRMVSDVSCVARNLQLADHLRWPRGKLAHGYLPTSLQHAHAHAAAGEASRGNPAAVAGPDDNGVVVALEQIWVVRQATVHVRSLSDPSATGPLAIFRDNRLARVLCQGRYRARRIYPKRHGHDCPIDHEQVAITEHFALVVDDRTV
jgi:hypothetical protein